jgi:hypothetical protein
MSGGDEMNRMKPILFSTEMVNAILDGRKTQTRRIVKPQPKTIAHDSKNRLPMAFWADNSKWIKPKYQVGDIIWVRETWSKKDGHYFYKAGHELLIDSEPLIKRWRPSIYMPREAARIFLRVTNVRVERLQEITEKDAKAEGVITNDAVKVSSYVYWFEMLWDDLNKKRGYGWETNPWVWVYELERVEVEK